jgi:hypothetical protein
LGLGLAGFRAAWFLFKGFFAFAELVDETRRIEPLTGVRFFFAAFLRAGFT